MKKILIAEDDPAIIDALTLILGAEGYEVFTAKNEAQIHAGLAKKPDLLLLDIRLSGIDGREICKMVKADNRYSKIPVLFMSANPDLEEIAQEACSDGFIRKPFEMAQLLAKLREYLS